MSDEMNHDEMITKLIDEYTNLKRIINASDPKAEAEYQLKIASVKLESCGIHTSELDK